MATSNTGKKAPTWTNQAGREVMRWPLWQAATTFGQTFTNNLRRFGPLEPIARATADIAEILRALLIAHVAVDDEDPSARDTAARFLRDAARPAKRFIVEIGERRHSLPFSVRPSAESEPIATEVFAIIADADPDARRILRNTVARWIRVGYSAEEATDSFSAFMSWPSPSGYRMWFVERGTTLRDPADDGVRSALAASYRRIVDSERVTDGNADDVAERVIRGWLRALGADADAAAAFFKFEDARMRRGT